MSWHEHLSFEVQSMFERLAGGNTYELLTEAMYQHRHVRRQQRREEYMELYSRLPTRLALRAAYKAAKERSRERVVAVRYCKICRKPYQVTAWDRANGRKCRLNTCSRQCGLMASGRHELIEIDGERLTLHGWCQRLGIPPKTVEHRIKKLGMNAKQALFASKIRPRRGNLIEIQGERKTVAEWARERGVSLQTVKSRLRRGWSLEAALGLDSRGVYEGSMTSPE